MIPQYMQFRHEPPTTFGDCFRACVASILELDINTVPHFHSDGCQDDGEITDRLNDWLFSEHELLKWAYAYPGSVPLADVMHYTGLNNPELHWILHGRTASGEAHAVICHGSVMVHDPSPWQTGGIVEPYENAWSIIIFVPAVLR